VGVEKGIAVSDVAVSNETGSMNSFTYRMLLSVTGLLNRPGYTNTEFEKDGRNSTLLTEARMTRGSPAGAVVVT
jgi:hypothetical protein